MKLWMRLTLLIVLLTMLPALPAVWITRQLIEQSLSLGLNPQVDGALEAGVRRAREQLADQRRVLGHELALWAADFVEPEDDQESLQQRAQAWQGLILQEPDRVELILADGELLLLQAGQLTPATPDSAVRHGSPPDFIEATEPLPDNCRLLARRPVTDWRDDALILASTLQMIRGLQVQRHGLENGFWLPFLVIYGIGLVLGLLVAWRLSGGITAPITRLLGATRAVAAGDWDVQLPEGGRDEIGRLTTRFNDMVRTLDAQNRRLVDLEKMAGWREMARALAHEVKNPLTPIQLTVEEMRQRYRGDDAEYEALLDECSRIVVQEVDSLRQLVTRFREFSRPVEPRFGPVDLNGLLADLASLQKDMQVELALAPDLETIEADVDQLRQVLMNLAQNARAATRQLESPRLRLATRRCGGDGSRVELTVEDNGPGIPAADREAIFEPYRSGTAGGLGLGLALVKGIVLSHGGNIVADAGQWGGACLRLNLPIHQPDVNIGLHSSEGGKQENNHG
ncbi:MAG: ATP-binding protein [bacterium]